MIYKIRVYNMGFGDCFLLYENNYKMMVDFGSISRKRNNLSAVINDVNNELGDGATGMLTHFHRDH